MAVDPNMNISALVQPGQPVSPTDASAASGSMPQPNASAPPPEAMTPGMAAPDVTDRSINPAVPPQAPAGANAGAPPKHAHLLAMVQGLADGLSAAGKSIATHGREGGAAEVQELQQSRAAAQQRATAAAQEQKSAEIGNALKTSQTNQINWTTQANIAQHKNDMALSDMRVQKEQQTLKKGALDIDTAVAGYQRENFGLMPLSQVPGGSTNAPVTPDERTRVNTSLGSAINLGTGVLGTSQDPTLSAAIDKAKAVVANPNASRADVLGAGQGLTNALQANKTVTEARTAQGKAAEVAPLGDKAANINAMTAKRYQVLNPGKPLPDEFKVSADSTPADYTRISGSLEKTEAAQGTAATRGLTNQIRQQTLDLLKGPQGIDPNATGTEYLSQVQKVDPGQADLLKGYGQGRLILSPAVARSAQGVALTKQILRAYPNYVQAKAEGYQKQYNEFTSGKIGTSINSYKTSLDHLNDAFDNVASASTVDLNNPTSKLHQQLDTDKEFLSTELAKAVSNGNMTEGEKAGMLKAIDGKILGVATKDKYQNQLREVVKLLGGKLNAFQSQWASTAVEGVEPPSNLTDAAAATQKLAGTATPTSHVFNATTWTQTHPGQDVNAAIAEAKRQGYQVKQ